MPDSKYQPIPVNTYMSQYGYWVVELSVTPWQRLSVMICQVGITPEQAISFALQSASPALAGM